MCNIVFSEHVHKPQDEKSAAAGLQDMKVRTEGEIQAAGDSAECWLDRMVIELNLGSPAAMPKD